MATFRKIHTIFWSDPFIQSLSPERKYFYLYLLTNEKTKQCGIYEITKKQISYDTGYNIDTVSILLKYFAESGKIAYSTYTSEICIKNWNKYNDNKSPKTQVLVKQEIGKVKDKKLIEYLYSTDTVSIHHQTKSEQEGEEEREKEEEREGEEKNKKIGSDLIYDIEKYLLSHQKDFETICINSAKDEQTVKSVLKKFHLHQIENNYYPKKPLQLIAGLQKWLINEKNFKNGANNGISNSFSSKHGGAAKLRESINQDLAARGDANDSGKV